MWVLLLTMYYGPNHLPGSNIPRDFETHILGEFKTDAPCFAEVMHYRDPRIVCIYMENPPPLPRR